MTSSPQRRSCTGSNSRSRRPSRRPSGWPTPSIPGPATPWSRCSPWPTPECRSAGRRFRPRSAPRSPAGSSSAWSWASWSGSAAPSGWPCGCASGPSPRPSPAASCWPWPRWPGSVHRLAVHRQPGLPQRRAPGPGPGRHPGRIPAGRPHRGRAAAGQPATPRSTMNRAQNRLRAVGAVHGPRIGHQAVRRVKGGCVPLVR